MLKTPLPSFISPFLLPSLRVECGASGKVRYLSRREDYLPLPINMDAATNKAEVAAFAERKKKAEETGERIKEEDKVRPCIPFQACLDQFCEEEQVRKKGAT